MDAIRATAADALATVATVNPLGGDIKPALVNVETTLVEDRGLDE
jgi:hypothetical protein